METEVTSALREKVSKIRIPERILIFFLSGLGDTLMFTPALSLLRKACPMSHIVGLTMKQSEFDVLNTNPDLNDVRIWKFLDESMFASLAHLCTYRMRRYDLTILPCPSNRLQYNIIAAVCGAHRRAGFRYLKQSRLNLDFLNNFLIPHVDDVHNAEQNIRLVEKITRISRGVHPNINSNIVLKTIPRDVEVAEEFIHKSRLIDKPFIGLHISSSRAKHMERKCWPKESFLEFIQKLQEQKSDMNFVIFCGDEDLEDSQWLIHKAGPARIHLAKNIPIRPIAEILKKSRLLVTNDSGIMHVAIAAEVATVALFGPTNPKRSGPWQSASSEVIRSDLPCSPCFYHTSHELTCPAGLNFECIRKLPVDKVLQRVLTILDH